MAKKKNILLTHGTLHVPLDQMMSIDIEGAPAAVKQVSIYDFNHELLYNKTAPSGKELPQGEITKIQRILNRARVLVGHSLDSDLMALRRRGVYLYNDTRCLDTYFTLLEMKEEGLLDNRYNGATLKETALYFHIRANDYHTSHTDALAAAVVMQEMMKQGDGMVVEITPSIIQIPRPPFGMEPDWEKEERGDMAQNKTIGPKADSRVYKIGDFYECVIAGGQGPTFVRMTQEEYDLFLRIRELRPDYTVRLYSETILTPSIVARLAALEEAEKAAPVASAPEVVEAPELIEEAESSISEEIEEAPVPAAVEIAEEIVEEQMPAVEAEELTAAAESPASAEISDESAIAEEARESAEEVEISISEEIKEPPVSAVEEVVAPEEIMEEESAPAKEIEELPAVADGEREEAEPIEEASTEMLLPRVDAEAIEAREEGHFEEAEAAIEELGEVSTEEVVDAKGAHEEAAAETEASGAVSAEAETAPVPLEESDIPVDVDYVYDPKVGTYVSVYPEAEVPVETASKAAEDGEENLISFAMEERDWPEELPPLPEESLEMASETLAGASEPLFGEGIWDLPEDFAAVKEKELPAEEPKVEEKKKDPAAEEDAFSMNLFGE